MISRSDNGAAPPYEFRRHWADLSAIPDAAASWAHNGIAVTSVGELIGFHAGQLVAFNERGELLWTVETELTEGHGITLVQEDGEEYLWICDPSFVFESVAGEGDDEWAPLFGKGIHRHSDVPRVVKMSMDGTIRSELPKPLEGPDATQGLMGAFCPCGCAVDEERFGGSGDIWVADGYGSSIVYRFDKDGNELGRLTGDEGGGRFLCPHSVYIDRRPGKPVELYIADRENRRVQVYDLEGRYVRTFGASFLSSPSGFAQWGETLVVAELYARLALLDIHDELVGYIGAETPGDEVHAWPDRPGWPNALDSTGRVAMAPSNLEQGHFNSPHSLAVDAQGHLYVSEWLIGGCYTSLGIRH
jgi:hypothetical protein